MSCTIDHWAAVISFASALSLSLSATCSCSCHFKMYLSEGRGLPSPAQFRHSRNLSRAAIDLARSAEAALTFAAEAASCLNAVLIRAAGRLTSFTANPSPHPHLGHP